MSTFLERVRSLPVLGLGVSTEYGAAAAPRALQPLSLRQRHPEWARFLEVGVETAKGLDDHARAWAAQGHPTTYHFLDVNLDEPEDLDEAWLDEVRRIIATLSPAWLCGDAGLWHFGPRDRNHMLLLPPILTADGAEALAWGIQALRAHTGLEVFPENPPGAAFVGDLHILDFFGRVAERADTGLLLDVAHLAIAQRLTGHQPLDGLDGFPVDRVVEVHVAGGSVQDHQGFVWVDDDHSPEVLDDTWAILEWLVPRAPNLRAVVYECERNSLDAVAPGYARIQRILGDHPVTRPRPGAPHATPHHVPEPPVAAITRTGAQQRVVVRLLHDEALVERLHGGHIPSGLGPTRAAQLLAIDRRAWGTDRFRRTRLLQALLEEFPVAATLASRGGRDLAAVDAFVSSEVFHDAIQHRRVVAHAFGEWLAARVGDVARVEQAIARSRRGERPGGVGWVCAPGVVPLTVPTGTLARWSAVRERLGSDPLSALASGVDLSGLPVPGAGHEHWLLEHDHAGSPALGGASAALNGLLQAARTPVPRPVLLDAAVRLGAEPDEAPALLDGLRADGLLHVEHPG